MLTSSAMDGAKMLARKLCAFCKKCVVKNGKEAIFYGLSRVPASAFIAACAATCALPIPAMEF